MGQGTSKGAVVLKKGYSVGYEIENDDPTLPTIVLTNGSLFNLTQWNSFIRFGLRPHLGNRIRIVRYDYGGTGRSLRPTFAWDAYEVADELIALLDMLKISTVHLYGISKGTIINQIAATKYPDRILSIGGYGWFHFDYSRMAAVARYFSTRLTHFSDLRSKESEPLTRTQFEKLWDEVYRRVLTQSSSAFPGLDFLIQFLFKEKVFRLLEPTPARVMYDWFDYAVRLMPIAGDLFRDSYAVLEKKPLCIQHAQYDGTLPVEMARELKARLTHATYREYGRGYNHVSVVVNPLHGFRAAGDYAKFLSGLYHESSL